METVSSRREPNRGGAQFPSTSWTLLAEVRAGGEAAKAARDELVARYYRPVRAYLQAIVRDLEKAEELTQSFFERVVLSGRLIRAADPGRGSFRPYVKKALRNFVADDRRRRPLGGAPVVRPDDATQGWDAVTDQTQPRSAETEYHNAWVRALLEVALEKVRETCMARGQQDHFQLFVRRYMNETGEEPSWRDLGQPFGLDEKAARNRTETVARHFRLVLRRILVEETGSAEEATAEVSALLELL
jgi:DNA-directed RNA polymerase specialized sigma24 family protein